jgi:hypothetical protein
MARPYIPNADSAFDAFANSFAARIAADPAAYGLSAGDAAAISAVVGAWEAAYRVAAAPSTRTQPAVLQKDEARRAAERTIRGFASRIRVNDDIPSDRKAALGIRPVPRSYARVQPPQSAPTLTVTEIGAARHTLIARDRGDVGGGPSESRKPPGAIGLLLFRIVADEPVRTPDKAEFLGFVTRGLVESLFTTADRGKTATYFARWTNAKGQMGPWSVPSVVAIAA